MFTLQVYCNGSGEFDLWNVVSTGIAVLALFASIATIVISMRQHTRTQRQALESELIQKLFEKYLTSKLPNARNKLRILGGQPSKDFFPFIDILNELRISLDYFTFADRAFHAEVVGILQQMEDMSVEAHNLHFTGRDQADFFQELDEKMTTLYHIVAKRYCGK